MHQLIQNVVDKPKFPKKSMRKKWMNALYQHVVFHGDEQDLPEYLLGWRYERLTQPLIQFCVKMKIFNEPNEGGAISLEAK
jgi:ribonuclease D